MKIEKKPLSIISYFAIVVCAVLFLYIGNMIAVNGLNVFNNPDGVYTVQAKVTGVKDTIDYSIGEDGVSGEKSIKFEALFL